MSTSISFNLVVVDGSVDEEASLLAAETAIANYVAEREVEQGTIAAAVNACFDEHKGARQNTPALVFGALRRLNATPANHKALEKKVADYLHENTDRQAKTQNNKSKGIEAEPERTRLFGMRKGSGGGIQRWSDIPVEPTTTDTK